MCAHTALREVCPDMRHAPCAAYYSLAAVMTVDFSALSEGIASAINNRKAGSGNRGILMLAATATVLPFIFARTICMRRFRPLLSLT